MSKILSLTSKEFESGFSASSESTRLGLLYTGSRLNPFITEGTIRFSQEPTELGAGVISGIVQSFAVDGGDMYANDASGNIYKLDEVFAAVPTVTLVKTGLTNTYGLEVLETTNSSKHLYVFQNTQIGRELLPDTDWTGNWTAGWKSITAAYRSDVNPTLRIDDTIYFGSKYVISMIQDNGSTDTDLYENQLDLPKDYIITALSTDGDYLIIAASKSVSSTLDYAETRVYFWDYKNKLDSWTRSYTIQDPQIRSMETKGGITYASGRYGLYAFAFSKEPERIREDVRQTLGYGNMSVLNEAITFGSSSTCVSYGKIKPGTKTAVFKLYEMPNNENVVALDTYSSNTYGIFATDTSNIFRQVLFSAPTTYNDASFITSKIDLKDTFKIERIDFIFGGNLASTDSMTVQLNSNGGSGLLSTTSFTNYGSVSRVKAYPTAGDIITDVLSLTVGSINGNFSLRQIDIYGERINR